VTVQSFVPAPKGKSGLHCWWGPGFRKQEGQQWRSEGCRRPGARYLDCAPGQKILSLRQKKIDFYPSKFLMTHFLLIARFLVKLVLTYPSKFLITFFYPINQRSSSFCASFTNSTKKFLFPPLYAIFTPIYVNCYKKALKIRFC